MYCPYCGASVTEQEQQCQQCGKTLPIFPSANQGVEAPVQQAAEPANAPQNNTQNNAQNGGQGQPYAGQPYGYAPYPPYGGQPYAGQPYGYAPPPPMPPRPMQGAKCPHCGSIIEYGIPQCPACQRQIEWMKPAKKTKEKDNNLFAILGFIASMVALFSAIAYIIGAIFPDLNLYSGTWSIAGILAIVFGVIGLVNRKHCKGKGKKFAIMAIAFGALALVAGAGIDVILSLAAGEGFGYGGDLFDILFFF